MSQIRHETPDGLRPLAVYFTTSSKEGFVNLSVDHTWSAESTSIVLYPDNALADVLELLEPAFAHYAAQWERFMVEDPDETDCVGFWLPADTLPEHIAPVDNWDRISEINWVHTPGLIKDWFGGRRPNAIYRWDPDHLMHGNIDDVVVEPHLLGVELLN